MAELKTRPTRRSVPRFIASVEHPVRRQDCETLLHVMSEVSGETAVLWGDSIVGFGRYNYRQRGGQRCSWPLSGFSPRKQNLTIYIMPGFERYKSHLDRLGKHRHSVSCLYLNRLADIDLAVLREIVADSIEVMRARYPD